MKFNVMLDANSPDFADFVDQLRNALGLRPGDTIEISKPQFERTDVRVINYFPRTVAEFDALKKLDDHALRAIGCGVWDEGHYLYPKEWYYNIPNGYPVVSIFGDTELFVPGEIDDDTRFGYLAYGFVKE